MLSLQENFTYNATFSRNVQYQFIIIISISYIKNNSRYSKNPPYNSFYSVLQHNNNYVAERTKEEKYMVKRRLKSIIATVLVAAMLTTMAPQVVCEAAETAWKIVNNQETPLDEVYFDCKKSDDATKSYLYGYKDGKVAIMDSDYNLVKKTDYDEIAAMKKKVNGVTAYIVSKKVGEEKVYGIISETGETIIEPKYAYIWSGDNAIQITKKVNGQELVGLLSYDDGKQIIPCEYKSIWSISKSNNNMLISAIDSNLNFNAILNGKIIITKKRENKNNDCYFKFDKYNEQECVLCKFIKNWDDEEDDDIIWSYFSYDGNLIKEMTNDEYEKEQGSNNEEEGNPEELYNAACIKWLNKACEDGEKHVKEFYKSNNIMLDDVKTKAYYDAYWDDFDNDKKNIKYYWVVVTGKYNDIDSQSNKKEDIDIGYFFIYDKTGKKLLSGRSFCDIKSNNENNSKEISSSINKREIRYLLDDSGWMCYLNIDDNNVEKLFEIKDDTLPDMFGSSDFKNQHYLYYNYGNIVETGDGYKRIFVYKDKKAYSYDYNNGDYYFVQDKSGLEMYHCGLDRKKRRKLNLEEEGKYDGRISWEDYGKLDIELDSLIHSLIDEVDTGLLVNDKSARKIYYLGEDKQYTYAYEELGVPEIERDEDGNELNGDIYIKYICDCSDDNDNNWIYFNLNINDNKQSYCVNIKNGFISNVLFDAENKNDIEKRYDFMVELGDKLYLYSSTNTNIVGIDKKSFKANVYKLKLNTENEEVDSLFVLDGNVYVQYSCIEHISDSSYKRYYGIMDLSGKKYIDALSEKCDQEFEFETYANYRYSKGRLYDNSLNLISKDANVYYVYNTSSGENINGVYEIMGGEYRSFEESWGTAYKYYTVKLAIFDDNIGKVIYESDDNVRCREFVQIEGYYIMSIYNSNSKTTERVIIDASTGEQLYDGDGYIYIDDFNKKFVVINKRKNSPTPVPTESATTAPTQTPISKPTESAVPAPTINPTEAPTSTVNPLGTPVPTSTTKPTQIPDGNITEGIIGPSQPTPTVRPTETPVPITTVKPTENPAQFPTITPTESPTATPVVKPVNTPAPTQKPTALPVTISVAKKSVKVKTGKSTKISYSAYNTKGKRVKVKAVSSNTKAAKVSVLSTSQLEITVPDNAKDGAVSKITLTNGKKKTTIKVTVQAVKNKVIKLEAENKKISVTKGDKLSVTYYYNAQNDKKKLTDKVKIKSSDEAIAKIVTKKILNGEITVKIKGVNKGKVDITVKVGSKSATTKVKVK